MWASAKTSPPVSCCVEYEDTAGLLQALRERAMRRKRQSHDLDCALIDAVLMDKLQVVQQLLLRGADVNARDREHQETPLMLARSEDVTGILLENGADILAVDDQGRTAFMRSLDPALFRSGMDINAQDQNGVTALMSAVEFALDEAVPWLLVHGADINAANQWGETALSIADGYGRVSIADLLKRARPSTTASNEM